MPKDKAPITNALNLGHRRTYTDTARVWHNWARKIGVKLDRIVTVDQLSDAERIEIAINKLVKLERILNL